MAYFVLSNSCSGSITISSVLLSIMTYFALYMYPIFFVSNSMAHLFFLALRTNTKVQSYKFLA